MKPGEATEYVHAGGPYWVTPRNFDPDPDRDLEFEELEHARRHWPATPDPTRRTA
jgi:hypothetical protein